MQPLTAYERWHVATETELWARLVDLDAGAEPISPTERAYVARRLAMERSLHRNLRPTSMWSPFADPAHLAPDARARAARDGRP